MTLSGCMDGYGDKEQAPVSPFEMDNQQRLHALNEVAARARRGERSHFTLEPDCRLQVARDAPAWQVSIQQHELRRGMFVDVSFNKDLQVFEVHLLDRAGPDSRRLGLLLRSTAWMQASKADLLVQLLIRDCRPTPSDETPATPGPANTHSRL